MRKLALTIGLAVAALSGARAYANQPMSPTIHMLYETCRSSDPLSVAKCTSYLQGAASMMRDVAILGQNPVRRAGMKEARLLFGICPKRPISAAELRRVFVHWVRHHPRKVHEHDDENIGVWAALRAAWPCR